MWKKYKIIIIAGAVLAVAIICFICVKLNAKKTVKAETSSEALGDISVADETSLKEFEDSGEAKPEEEEEESPSEISKEDAELLLEEKLSGKPCTPIYSEVSPIDGENYYTFTVLDANEEEMEQMLAVNAVSGEVFVYDIEDNTVFDFSTFELYNSESDARVSWEGTFRSGSISVTLEPVDSESFEFSFTGGSSELTGVARADGRTAAYKDSTVSLEFTRTEKGLEIKDTGGKSGFAGQYE